MGKIPVPYGIVQIPLISGEHSYIYFTSKLLKSLFDGGAMSGLLLYDSTFTYVALLWVARTAWARVPATSRAITVVDPLPRIRFRCLPEPCLGLGTASTNEGKVMLT